MIGEIHDDNEVPHVNFVGELFGGLATSQEKIKESRFLLFEVYLSKNRIENKVKIRGAEI